MLFSLSSPIFAHFGIYEIADQINSILFSACHHKPDKCFWIFEYPMPLCCRCFGFYLSFFIYGIISAIKSIKIPLVYLILVFLGFSIDFIINYLFKITTWNITRFISGACLAVLLIHLIIVVTKGRKDKV